MEKTLSAGNPLGTEKISKLLFRYSFPSIIAMLVSSLYNIVDQIFIGQGLGYLGNGATTVVFPLSTICLAIALLLGVGGASCYSLQLGEGRPDEAARTAGTALSFMFLSGLIYLVLGELSITALLPVLAPPRKTTATRSNTPASFCLACPFSLSATAFPSFAGRTVRLPFPCFSWWSALLSTASWTRFSFSSFTGAWPVRRGRRLSARS
ncbi:hypothetical protein KWG61_01420 [Allobaculum sp. Allo2]|nr:hypothetical protein KWG61_01420 [Allobaculum sp. Allo2]